MNDDLALLLEAEADEMEDDDGLPDFIGGLRYAAHIVRANVCRDCGGPWRPVRRGECSFCGSDAGPLPYPAEGATDE